MKLEYNIKLAALTRSIASLIIVEGMTHVGTSDKVQKQKTEIT